jgi:hypothetical protein
MGIVSYLTHLFKQVVQVTKFSFLNTSEKIPINHYFSYLCVFKKPADI